MSIPEKFLEGIVVPYARDVFGGGIPVLKECKPLSLTWRIITSLSLVFLGQNVRAFVYTDQIGETGIYYDPRRFGNQVLKRALGALRSNTATDKQKELIGDLLFTLFHEYVHVYQPLFGQTYTRESLIWHEGTAEGWAYILSSRLSERLQCGDVLKHFPYIPELGILPGAFSDCMKLYVRGRIKKLHAVASDAPISIKIFSPAELLPPGAWICLADPTTSFSENMRSRSRIASWRIRKWNRILLWQYAIGAYAVAQALRAEEYTPKGLFRDRTNQDVWAALCHQ